MDEGKDRRPLSKMLPKRLSNNLAAYPHETSIHGVKYLVNANRSLPERIFWIAIIILSITCLGYFVVNIIIAWIEFPVTLIERKQPTHIFRIPFPAVTICPAIKSTPQNHNSSLDEFWDTEPGQRIIMKSQICRHSYKSFYQRILNMSTVKPPQTLSTNWKDTLFKMSPNLDDVIKSCQLSLWHESMIKSTQNCQHLFSPIITNEGVCFTFNTVAEVLRNESLHNEFAYYDIKNASNGWDPESGYSKHKAYPYKAKTEGLLFTLLANSSDISPICNPSTLGYKILLHSPAVYPHTYDGFIALDYGFEYVIAVKPKTISTSRSLKSFSPEMRNCYYQGERHLKYYTYYNEENCKLECYTNYTIQILGGAPFSSPRNSNTTNYKLPSSNFGWKFPNNYALLREYNKVNRIYNTNRVRDSIDTDCNCLPDCFSLKYGYEILATNVEFVQSIQATRNLTSTVFRTSLEIIFDETSFVGKKRVEMYTFVTFISDFGGLLGLFLGGSVLSLFELIYFLIIRNRCKRN